MDMGIEEEEVEVEEEVDVEEEEEEDEEGLTIMIMIMIMITTMIMETMDVVGGVMEVVVVDVTVAVDVLELWMWEVLVVELVEVGEEVELLHRNLELLKKFRMNL